MSVRLPPMPRRCHLFSERAASLLAVGVGLLLGTAAVPATAADGLRLARSPHSFKAGKALLSQAARYTGKPAVTGADGGHPRGPRRQKGKPPRWRSAPIVAFPDGPGRGAFGQVSRRSERPAATRDAQSQAVLRQVLIVLDQNQSGDLANEFARRHGLERKQTQLMSLLSGRCELYELRANRSLAQVMAALRGDPRVRLVKANFRYRTQGASATPAAVLPQYALDKIALPQAHELARGRDVVVAVIDQTHPDLQGAITLSFDAAGTPDRRGSFHGTAVAGIIRAQGVVGGAAPQALILAVRALRVGDAGAVAQTASWTLLRAIQWAVENKANVLNLSFVGPKDEALHLALRSATSRRVIVVAAAGNNGPKATPAFPAAYPEVIAVTAVYEKDHRYAQANRGSYIGFAAPGVDILAPVVKGKHSYLSGTSFATACVGGLVALLLERNRGLDTGAVVDLIAAGAEELGPQGRDEDFGAGRVNAFAALKALKRMRDGTNR
jgi:subtilisin family serine protease